MLFKSPFPLISLWRFNIFICLNRYAQSVVRTRSPRVLRSWQCSRASWGGRCLPGAAWRSQNHRCAEIQDFQTHRRTEYCWASDPCARPAGNPDVILSNQGKISEQSALIELSRQFLYSTGVDIKHAIKSDSRVEMCFYCGYFREEVNIKQALNHIKCWKYRAETSSKRRGL